MKNQIKYLIIISSVFFIITGIGYIVLPPFYEEEIWKVLVPALGTIDFIVAYALFNKNALFIKYSRIYAGATLLVAVPFWGK